MTIKSLKLYQVIDDCRLSPTLIRGLVRWHGGWKDFKGVSSDISNYGANTGISFIYYDDSVKFFRGHAKGLKSWLTEISSELYDCGLLEMVQKWKLDCYTLEEIGQAIFQGKGEAVNDVFHTIVIAAVEELANTVCNCVE